MISRSVGLATVAIVLAWALGGCATAAEPVERFSDAGLIDVGAGRDAQSRRDTPGPDACAETPCGVSCVNTSVDPLNCGGCGRACSVPDGTAGCAAGACTVASCADGFFDADGEVENGCEATTPACTPGGDCVTTCDTTGQVICTEGVMGCAPPAETCNWVDDNCDGSCDASLGGCRRGIHRGVGRGHVYSANPAVPSTAPYRTEVANYFYLYAASTGTAQPFFRCEKADGQFFLTNSTACEGAGARVEDLGFIAMEPVCGSTPLYRMYNSTNRDHFYTISASERDNAASMYGYRLEATVGHVWLAP